MHFSPRASIRADYGIETRRIISDDEGQPQTTAGR